MMWSIELSSGHVVVFPLKECQGKKSKKKKKYGPLCKTVLGGKSSSSCSQLLLDSFEGDEWILFFFLANFTFKDNGQSRPT